MPKYNIHVTVDAQLKQQVSDILAEMDLTLQDLIQHFLEYVATHKSLPFSIKIPNAETIQAMKDADSGNLHHVNSIDELFIDMQNDSDAEEK